MNKLFVPYEIALQLKEKGFDEPCIGYHKNSEIILCSYKDTLTQKIIFDNYGGIKAPFYQQVIDWFREKYFLCIEVTRSHFDGYTGNITFNVTIIDPREEEYSVKGKNIVVRDKDNQLNHQEYYLALSKGIEEALKLI